MVISEAIKLAKERGVGIKRSNWNHYCDLESLMSRCHWPDLESNDWSIDEERIGVTKSVIHDSIGRADESGEVPGSEGWYQRLYVHLGFGGKHGQTTNILQG